MPRVLVVVAQPDDETFAIGARMTRFSHACFLHLTDGAPVNRLDAKAYGFPPLDTYRDTRFAERTPSSRYLLCRTTISARSPYFAPDHP